MKPFQGIIRNWRFTNNAVYGYIVWHKRHNPETTEFEPGHRIRTSRLVSTEKIPGSDFRLCETENSFYILFNGEET